MTERSEFGEHLKQLRKRKDWSVRKLALRVGMDPSYLRRIEEGERPPPDLVYIARLAKELEVDVMELLELAEAPRDILEAFALSEQAEAYFTRVRKRRAKEKAD